jgi:hypothetical protein
MVSENLLPLFLKRFFIEMFYKQKSFTNIRKGFFSKQKNMKL